MGAKAAKKRGVQAGITGRVAGMVVYDNRLADAARRAGITVWAPA